MSAVLRQIDPRRMGLFLATATAVIAAWLWLLNGSFYSRHPSVAEIGAAFDLLIALPLIFWLVSGRRLSTIRREMTIVCLATIAVALTIIPGALRAAGSMFWIVELMLIGAAVVRIRESIRRSPSGQPIELRIREVSRDLVPFRPAADALASELSLIVFAFSGRRFLARPMPPHRWKETDGWFGVVIGLCLAVVAESIAIHLLMMERFPVLVWVILALDLYGLVWLIGDARALARSGVRLDGSSLVLEFGLRWRGRVEIADIASIESFTEDAELDLSLALIESPDLILTFEHDVVFTAVYGIRRKARRVGVRIENAPALLARLEEIRGESWQSAPEPEPPVPAARTSEQKTARTTMTREAWLRTRPDYIPLADWLRSKPPWVE